MTKKKNHYIDDNEFWEAMNEYITACKEAEANDEDYPPIPEFVGKCFMLLADNVAKAPNFSRYMFLEEMKSDAIINCVKYLRNFKPYYKDKATGKMKKAKPFAYFSQYVINTFKQRIKLEKTNLYIRYKELEAFDIEQQLTGRLPSSRVVDNIAADIRERSGTFIQNFEDAMEREKERKKEKRAQSTNALEQFFEDE